MQHILDTVLRRRSRRLRWPRAAKYGRRSLSLPCHPPSRTWFISIPSPFAHLRHYLHVRCSLLNAAPHTVLVQSQRGATRSRVRDSLIPTMIALYAIARLRCSFNISLTPASLTCYWALPYLCVSYDIVYMSSIRNADRRHINSALRHVDTFTVRGVVSGVRHEVLYCSMSTSETVYVVEKDG